MDELVKTVKIFLTRDVIYIMGGTSVIGVVYYVIGHDLNMHPRSPASYFIILGIGHFLGFALQSFGNFIRVVNVESLVKPGRFVRWLYGRYTRKTTWYAPDPLIDVRFPQYVDERPQAEIDRIITLKQIAATMGSCSMTIIIIISANCVAKHSTNAIDISGILGGFVFFVIFAPLSYIVSAEQAQFITERTLLPERIREKAYFIWENDKSKSAEVCWAEARNILFHKAELALKSKFVRDVTRGSRAR